MTTTAVADESTIRARIEEALAVYPLPQPYRVRARADRSVGCSPDLSPERLQLLRDLPPVLNMWWRTTREMQAWAAHLGFGVEVRVRTYEDDGRTCRTVEAHGMWLGWSVYLASDEDTYRDVTPAPLAIVRRARLGVL